MVSVLIVMHGRLAPALLEAAERIAGRRPGCEALEPASPGGEGLEPLRDRIVQALSRQAAPDGAVILTDMPGGTPFHAAALAAAPLGGSRRVRVIGGANLAMAVTALAHCDRLPLEELVEKILQDGVKSIRPCDIP